MSYRIYDVDVSVVYRLKERHLPVYPTHSCFADAMRVFRSNRITHKSARLVHAECLMPQSGRRFAHAWVEVDWPIPEALFMGVVPALDDLPEVTILLGQDRRVYVEALQVQHATRYTLKEAAAMGKKHGHSGPWLPRYAVICANGSDATTGDAEALSPKRP